MNCKITCLLILSYMLAGCAASPGYWYKAGKNQHDFDIDSRDCEISAQQLSKGHSETGKQIEPASYNRIYSQCISNKGWSRTPPEDPFVTKNFPNEQHTIEIAAEGHALSAFKQTITIPLSFSLISRNHSQVGPTVMEQFTWQDADNTFINVIFQENHGTFFEKEQYPVLPPFYLYDSGTGANKKVEWAAFFGEIQNEWVMGLGANFLKNKTKRIIIVITKSLSQPSSTPPDRVQLSKNQYDDIEAFSNQWQPWLEAQFPKN